MPHGERRRPLRGAAIACQESNVVWRTQKAASLRGAAKRSHDISFLTVNKRRHDISFLTVNSWMQMEAALSVALTFAQSNLVGAVSKDTENEVLSAPKPRAPPASEQRHMSVKKAR
jgi:hypothetical protein